MHLSARSSCHWQRHNVAWGNEGLHEYHWKWTYVWRMGKYGFWNSLCGAYLSIWCSMSSGRPKRSGLLNCRLIFRYHAGSFTRSSPHVCGRLAKLPCWNALFRPEKKNQRDKKKVERNRPATVQRHPLTTRDRVCRSGREKRIIPRLFSRAATQPEGVRSELPQLLHVASIILSCSMGKPPLSSHRSMKLFKYH